MLIKNDTIIRYYIIDKKYIEYLMRVRKHENIILPRPTRWSYFIRGVLHLDEDLAFIRLLDSLVEEFVNGHILAVSMNDGRIKINAHTPIKIEQWSFWNMCKFCLEGIQYGTFLKFWKWRW